MLYRDPSVFVVENEYQIAFNTLEKGIAWLYYRKGFSVFAYDTARNLSAQSVSDILLTIAYTQNRQTAGENLLIRPWGNA